MTGPNFFSLHQLFEQQYKELTDAIDELAERIRALDEPAPGSYTQFSKLSHIKEAIGIYTSQEMIQMLHEDQLLLIQTLKKGIEAGTRLADLATVDLLTKRVEVHEKNAWMLNSLLASENANLWTSAIENRHKKLIN